MKSGLLLAAKTLVAIATGGLFFAGIAAVFIPSLIRPESFLAHSVVFGWGSLTIATAILILTMNRWAKILPGLLAYGALGGLLAIVSGRLSGSPNTRISRSEVIFITLFLAVSSALSFALQKRNLNTVDRIALMIFAFCLALSVSPKQSTMLMTIGIGLASLLFALVYGSVAGKEGM